MKETKKQIIDSWMKDNNLTEEDLDFMWEFCAVFDHPVIKYLYDRKISWWELNPETIKTLPKVYEKIMKREIFTTED